MADMRQKVQYEMEMAGLDKTGADLQSVAAQSDKASGSVTGLSDQFALGALKAQAIGMAVGFVTDMLKAIPQEIENVTRLNAEIYDGAMRAGLLVEEYQALGFVLRQAGGNIDDAQRMIRLLNGMLNASSTEGTRQREIIEGLGLSYQDLRNGTPEQAFYAVTDAVGQLSTAQERNLTLAALFGARYSQVVSGALNQTNGSIRNASTSLLEQGVIIREDTVAAYDVLGDAQVALQARMEALKSEALLPVIPVLMDIIDLKTDLADNVIPKAGEAVTNFVYVMGESLEVLIDVARALDSVHNGYKDLPRGIQLFINPLGASVVAINKAAGAMRESEGANKAVTEAYARQAEQVELSRIAMNLMNAELDLTPEQLRGMAASLSEMTLMADAAEPILQQINERLAECTWQTTAALGPLGAYSQTELDRAVAVRQSNIALLEQWELMGKSGPAMQERIQRIRDEIDLLKEQQSTFYAGVQTTLPTVSGGRATADDTDVTDPKEGGITKADAMAREIADAMAMQAEYMDSLYEFRATKEAQFQEMVLSQEQAAWETRYEIGMHYVGMMSNMLVTEWENGFKDIGKAFEKMVTRMVAELGASGLLSWGSSLLGGGPVGIFGQIFGGGK